MSYHVSANFLDTTMKEFDSGQNWLVELMQKLGLPSNEGGVCYGVSHSAMQAKQAGEFERFRQRLTDLYEFGLDEKKINSLKNKLTEPNQEMSKQELDFVAFLQTVEVYHQLYLYPELQAEGALTTAQTGMASLSILKPVVIEQKEKAINKTLSPINSSINAYPEENITGEGFTLQSYLENVKDLFSSSEEPISLILGSANHVIFVSYDKNDKNWTLVDPNNVSETIRSTSEGDIATSVSESFNGGNVVFNTTIWGYKDDQLQSAADSIINNLSQDRNEYISTLNQEEVDDYIDLRDYHGNTPLYVAASFNCIETVKSLLEANADLDIQINHDFTALQIAIQNGHDEIAVLLIKNDADLNLKDKDGNSPLHLATQNGKSTIVKHLLKEDADVDLKNADGLTPLHIAAKSGNDDIVKQLLKADADMGAKSKQGETPLLMAATKGHVNVVDRLLEKDASFDFASQPYFVKRQLSYNLMDAVKDGDLNKTRSLLKLGVPPNLNYGPGELPNHKQGSSLVAYARETKNDDIYRVLIEHGAEPPQKRSGPPQKPLPLPPDHQTTTPQKSAGPPKKPVPLPGMARHMLANSNNIRNPDQGSEKVAEKANNEERSQSYSKR